MKVVLVVLVLATPAWAYEEVPAVVTERLSQAVSPEAETEGAAALSASTTVQAEAEEYVVTGRAANRLGKAASASSGSVSQEDLAHRALLRPAEVLEAVPGMLITQHSGDGKANQYFTRGFNLDHGTDFSFNVDDLPINLVTDAHAEGYTDLNFLLPELVKEVNYTKGPFNPEYGDFATAGSANFVYPLTLKQSIASVTLGEFGYQRGFVAGSFRLLGGDALLALEASGYDGPWDVPEGNKKYNGFARYSTEVAGGRWVVSLSSLDSHWTATNQTPQRAVAQGLIDAFGSLDPTDGGNTRIQRLWTSWEGPSLGGRTMAMAYVVNAHLQLWNDFSFFDRHPVEGDQFEQEDERTTSGGKVRQQYESSLGGRELKTEFGLDVRNDNVTTLSLFDSIARVRQRTDSLSRVIETDVGPYAKVALQWTPTLRGELSMRQDFLALDVEGATPETSGHNDSNIPEPKAALAWRPGLGPLELYANYGWGYHSNDGRIITPAGVGGGAARSPLVQAKGEELGLRLASGDHYEGTLAVWRLTLDSELTFDGDSAASGVSNPSTRQGFELSNTFRWNPLFLDLDWALSQARFDTQNTDDPLHPGLYVPESVENALTATLGLNPVAGWSSDLRVRFFGGRALTADDEERSPDLTLVSLRLSRELTRNLSLTADVFNLLNVNGPDVSYYYPSRLKNEAAEVDDFNTHPTEPRSLRVTLVSRF
jgi:outer membrane receptor protein involved in Fe transport